MDNESLALWSALLAYTAAGCLAIFSAVFRKRSERWVLGLLATGLALHTLAIALRWERLGHGPFLTMFEILSSNIWSLTLIFALAYWRFPPVRPIAAFIMPVIFMMMGWMLLTSPGGGHLPPTYDTIWLYIHIGLGKVFLGSVLISLGIAAVILLRTWTKETAFPGMPGNGSLEELAYRFMTIGFIFDSLMLVSGAIWAQDAWGRYWNWDPLETWAFLTWLILGFAIHARLTLRPSPAIASVMVLAVFVMGFLTFFGIPFISQAPHKGMV